MAYAFTPWLIGRDRQAQLDGADRDGIRVGDPVGDLCVRQNASSSRRLDHDVPTVCKWRRGGDSNPRSASRRLTVFETAAFSQLCHLSAAAWGGRRRCRHRTLDLGSGGEGGIRTHETGYPRLRDFQSRSLGQLGHLSAPAPKRRAIIPPTRSGLGRRTRRRRRTPQAAVDVRREKKTDRDGSYASPARGATTGRAQTAAAGAQ